MSTTSLLAGVAGEYFVAAELSRRGIIASITLRNTRGTDIIATNSTASKTVTIQCKTSRTVTKIWILGDKSEDYFSDTHFYAFVGLGDDNQRPVFHIVPSCVVAETIKSSHRAWLMGTTPSGKPRKDSSIRKFADKDDRYLERWDLLGL